MKNIITILCSICLYELSLGQEHTVGTLTHENTAFDGYTLFSPAGNTIAYLISNNGQIVNQWESVYPPGNAVYLMEDGSLYRAGRTDDDRIRAGGAGGVIEKFDWEGNVLWSYENSSANSRAHHDFQVLPNGNILVLAWELIDKETMLANGRNPEITPDTGLWPEMILEIEPTGNKGGNVVWEWHAWDHLIQNFDETKLNYGVVTDEVGKINLNYVKEGKEGSDWHHANSINYNTELDQIMISVLHFDEVWVIDHNTTTEEAKGEQGDLLFRWGNPFAYGIGKYEERLLFGQHNAHWIADGLPDAGKMMIFNNGRDRPAGEFTSVVKINPVILADGTYQKTLDNGYDPLDYYYEYRSVVPTDFYSWYISGAQQLANGHLLINDGAHGIFFEIDNNEKIVWKYVNPVVGVGPLNQGQEPVSPAGDPLNAVFRALKYDKSYGAFNGRILTPGAFVEIVVLDAPLAMELNIYPNPATDFIQIKNIPTSIQNIAIINANGQTILKKTLSGSNTNLQVSDLTKGMYYLVFDDQSTHRLIVQ